MFNDQIPLDNQKFPRDFLRIALKYIFETLTIHDWFPFQP